MHNFSVSTIIDTITAVHLDQHHDIFTLNNNGSR